MSNAVAFIDLNVDDYQTLLAKLAADVEVCLLNTEGNGVLQIANILKNRTDLDSIQVFSHGGVGSLYLGSSVLNNDNLAFYADVLTQIGSAMSETGDIMLYGCDVAQGDEGLSFINELAAITGADVAASDDLTGNTFAGADWDLEKTMGNIEATALVQNDVVGFGNNRLATNTAPTGTVTIAYNTYSTSPAAPEQFETLTADTSTLADDDVLGAFSYQWKANSINIDSAVTPTYQLKTHHSLNFTQGS